MASQPAASLSAVIEAYRDAHDAFDGLPASKRGRRAQRDADEALIVANFRNLTESLEDWSLPAETMQDVVEALRLAADDSFQWHVTPIADAMLYAALSFLERNAGVSEEIGDAVDEVMASADAYQSDPTVQTAIGFLAAMQRLAHAPCTSLGDGRAKAQALMGAIDAGIHILNLDQAAAVLRSIAGTPRHFNRSRSPKENQ